MTQQKNSVKQDAKQFLNMIERRNRRIDAMLQTADGYIKKARRGNVMNTETLNTFINLAAELPQESEELRKSVEKARKAIKGLGNEDEKLFIELRYFHGLKIESIANVMRCSPARVYRIQTSTIKHVQELIDAGLVDTDV